MAVNSFLARFRQFIKLYALQADVTQLSSDTDAAMDPIVDGLVAFSLAKVKTTIKMLISQTSTGAPTITATFENSAGVTPVFAYVSAGVYTLAGVTTTAKKNKTLIRTTLGGTTPAYDVLVDVIASDLIGIRSFNVAGTATDALITDMMLEVDLYN